MSMFVPPAGVHILNVTTAVPATHATLQSHAPATQLASVTQESGLSEAQKPFLAHIESLIKNYYVEGFLVPVRSLDVQSESLSPSQDLENAILYLLDRHSIWGYAKSPRPGEFLIKIDKDDIALDFDHMCVKDWTVSRGVCEHALAYKAFDMFAGETCLVIHPIGEDN